MALTAIDPRREDYRYTVGPKIGGILGERFGDGAPAFLAVSLFAALIPITLFFLPETSPRGSKQAAAQRKEIRPMASFQGNMDDGRKEMGEEEQVLVGEEGDRSSPRRRVLALLALIVLPEFAVVAYSTTGLSSLVVHGLGEGKAFLGNINSTTAAGAAICSGIIIPWLSKTIKVKDRSQYPRKSFISSCFNSFSPLAVATPHVFRAAIFASWPSLCNQTCERAIPTNSF